MVLGRGPRVTQPRKEGKTEDSRNTGYPWEGAETFPFVPSGATSPILLLGSQMIKERKKTLAILHVHNSLI